MALGSEEYTKKKNRHKVFKVLVQIVILVVIAYISVKAIFVLDTYKHYRDEGHTYTEDNGFIALSYFGVERLDNSPSLITVERLRQHIAALHRAGYVTVTQEDILDYYHNGVNLPERALFLSFEDGRRDTTIFAQRFLEEFNYKATVLTYAENLDTRDPKFLRYDELLELEKSTYWELGSNGYRLYFINVFDRHDNYLGELSPLEHSRISPYLGRRYNHYLMDYIRDENSFLRESFDRLRQRINFDYEALENDYTQTIGKVPGLYILMHSNTGGFGNNATVNGLNQYWIKKLFNMNFNREGLALNLRNSSIYDLTRMQPQAYWYANHLIMRINDNIEKPLPFVVGDEVRHAKWDVIQGALEAQDERLILTSLPEGTALMRLKDISAGDMKFDTVLTGNKFGRQSILLRCDEKLDNYLAVELVNNYFYVREKVNGIEKELFKLNLDRHDGIPVLSVEEDKKNAQIRVLETFIRYAPSVELARLYTERLQQVQAMPVRTVEEGAEEFVPQLSIHAPGRRQLHINLKDSILNVSIDERPAAQDIKVSVTREGGICFATAWGEYGWSQRNITDEVYDGVWEEIVITKNTGAEKEEIIFTDKLDSYASFIHWLNRRFEALLNWFIVNL